MTGHIRRLMVLAVMATGAGLVAPQPAPAQPAAWERVASFEDHKAGVNQLAFSPDGKALASASSDKTVGLLDVGAKQRTALLRGQRGRVFSIAFSPDGKTLASGGENQVVTWDADKQTVLGDHYGFPELRDAPDPNILSLAYSPDGDRLMAHGFALEENRVSFGYRIYSLCQIWDTKSGRLLNSFGRTDSNDANQAVPSPDWKRLLFWRNSHLWLADPYRAEAASRQEIETDIRSGSIEYVPLGSRAGFAPGGWAFSISNPRQSLILWRYQRLKLERVAPPWQPAGVQKVTTAAFSPDGKTLAVGLTDKEGKEPHRLKLLSYADGRLREVHDLGTAHPDVITAIAFSPDGRTMASGCQGGFINLWAGK